MSITKYVGKRGTTYQVRVERTDPITGKRKQIMETFRRKKDAEAFETDWESGKARGLLVDPSKMTVAEYLRDWLAGTAKPAVAPTTYQSYESLVRVRIIPGIGTISLQKLAPLHVKQFYTALASSERQDGKKGSISARTIRYCHAVLTHALKDAVRLRLVPLNVAADVPLPRNRKPDIEFWNEAEAQRFLKVADTDTSYGPIWRAALSTGCRKGGLLGLRWQDLDFGKRLLHVRQNVTHTKEYGLSAGPTKNKLHRSMTIDQELIAALKAHRASQPLPIDMAQRDAALVFTSSTGTMIDPRNLTHRFETLVKQAGVKVISFHGMRHTHATLLLLHGVDIKTVSERLGHASIQITLDTYAHVLPQMEQRAAEAIARALSG